MVPILTWRIVPYSFREGGFFLEGGLWRLHYLMNNAIGIVQEYREIAL
jgi:hypothetical protein